MINFDAVDFSECCSEDDAQCIYKYICTLSNKRNISWFFFLPFTCWYTMSVLIFFLHSQIALQIVGTVLLTIILVYQTLAIAVPLFIILVLLTKYSLIATTSVKRLDGTGTSRPSNAVQNIIIEYYYYFIFYFLTCLINANTKLNPNPIPTPNLNRNPPWTENQIITLSLTLCHWRD